MEIREMRVGNLIKIDGIICKVDERTIFDFNTDGRIKEPIQLTEEVLLKCGAKETESYTYEFTQIGKDIDLCVKFCELDILVTIWQGDPIYLRYEFVDFHLHTLQNLIHALTGEELTYNH